MHNRRRRLPDGSYPRIAAHRCIGSCSGHGVKTVDRVLPEAWDDQRADRSHTRSRLRSSSSRPSPMPSRWAICRASSSLESCESARYCTGRPAAQAPVRFGRWDAIHHERQTNKAVPRLIHNRPGPVGCENAWTGPLRRSSAPARKKAIVGKS